MAAVFTEASNDSTTNDNAYGDVFGSANPEIYSTIWSSVRTSFMSIYLVNKLLIFTDLFNFVTADKS